MVVPVTVTTLGQRILGESKAAMRRTRRRLPNLGQSIGPSISLSSESPMMVSDFLERTDGAVVVLELTGADFLKLMKRIDQLGLQQRRGLGIHIYRRWWWHHGRGITNVFLPTLRTPLFSRVVASWTRHHQRLLRLGPHRRLRSVPASRLPLGRDLERLTEPK